MALLSILAASVVYIGYRTEKGAPVENRAGRVGASGPPASAREPPPDSDLPTAALELAIGAERGGRVVDVEGRPIAGAEVRLAGNRDRTDAQGRFVLPLMSGELEVTHAEYFPRRIREAAIPRSDRKDPVVVLFRGGRIRGRVTDLRGRPIDGVRVTFAHPAETADGATTGPALAARTNPEGRYESPMLRPGVRRVHFRHRNYVNRESVVLSSLGRVARWDVVLLRGEPLTVIVKEDGDGVRVRDGDELPDARIRLLRTDRHLGREETLDLGHTGDDGRLTCRWSPDPRWRQRIRVSLPGYRETERDLHGNAIEVQLLRAAALDGVAVVATGKNAGLPVRVHAVRLEFAGLDGFAPVPTRGVLSHSLEPGHFRVGLPDRPGRYRAAVTGEGEFRGLSSAFVFDGLTSPAPLIVRLERRHCVAGTILLDGAPAAGSSVELRKARQERAPGSVPESRYDLPAGDAPRPLKWCVTGAEGSFHFEDLGPGRYHIRATHRGQATAYSAALDLPLPAPITLTLRHEARHAEKVRADDDVQLTERARGVLVGAVTTGADTLAGLELVLRGPLSPSRVAADLSLQTDEQGRFRVRGLEPGSYRLSCPFPPFQRRFEMRREGRVELNLNLTPQDVVIRLGRLSGDGTRPVTAEIGAVITVPRSGLRVLAFTNVGEREPSAPETPRPFVIRRALDQVIVRGLFPGRYRLSLQGARYLPYHRDFELENRLLRIDAVLRPGFPVRLPPADGGSRLPARGPATVIVLQGDEEVYRTVDRIGEVVFIPVLEPGRYRMTILGENGETFSRRFEVE